MTIEEKITLGVAVITGAKWVYEYSKKITWEKNKFLMENMKNLKIKILQRPCIYPLIIIE